MDVFEGKYRTAEGYPVAVGGLCEEGAAEECRRGLEALNGARFGDYTDCVAVDVRLSGLLREYADERIRILAATIRVPDCRQACGAVIGDPFSETRSAESRTEQTGEGICVYAEPGSFGFAGVLREGVDVAQVLIEKDAEAQKKSARRQLDPFVLVTDGSGGPEGRLFVRKGGAEREIVLNEQTLYK